MPAPTVSDFLDRLNVAFPPIKAAGWDPVGLQVGDPVAPRGRVAVCHDVTQTVVDAAISAQVGVLVAYHPLLFRPTTAFVAGSSPSGRAHRLAASGISLIVVHTAFDVAPGGAADALATALGLEEITGFAPLWGSDTAKVVVFVPPDDADRVAAAMSESGAGVIGAYTGCSFRTTGLGTFTPGPGAEPVAGVSGVSSRVDEVAVEMVCPERSVDAVVAAIAAAHPYEEPAFDVYHHRGNAGFVGRLGSLPNPMSLTEFAGVVGDAVGGVMRVTTAAADSLRRIAVVPGSGAEFISAVAGSADAIVTGDVRHHDARRAVELGLAVLDPGHAATERPGLRSLYAAVSQIVDDVHDLTDIDSSPWKE